jgi:hypothetical protein
MRWAGHVALSGTGGVYTGFWWENLRERDNLGDPGLDGKIILKWLLKWDGGTWIGLIWLRMGLVAGTCKRHSEPSLSIKCGEFLDFLSSEVGSYATELVG